MIMDKSYYEVLSRQAGIAADNLESAAPGSDERLNEAKILKEMAEALLEAEKADGMAFLEQERMSSEKKRGWLKLALEGASIAVGAVLGFAGFKYNLEYGNLVGKDGMKWSDFFLKKH